MPWESWTGSVSSTSAASRRASSCWRNLAYIACTVQQHSRHLMPQLQTCNSSSKHARLIRAPRRCSSIFAPRLWVQILWSIGRASQCVAASCSMWGIRLQLPHARAYLVPDGKSNQSNTARSQPQLQHCSHHLCMLLLHTERKVLSSQPNPSSTRCSTQLHFNPSCAVPPGLSLSWNAAATMCACSSCTHSKVSPTPFQAPHTDEKSGLHPTHTRATDCST